MSIQSPRTCWNSDKFERTENATHARLAIGLRMLLGGGLTSIMQRMSDEQSTKSMAQWLISNVYKYKINADTRIEKEDFESYLSNLHLRPSSVWLLTVRRED